MLYLNWLDGYIARKMKLKSSFGAFLDPVADKLMVAATLVLLCTRPLDAGVFGQAPCVFLEMMKNTMSVRRISGKMMKMMNNNLEFLGILHFVSGRETMFPLPVTTNVFVGEE
ncbi:unnamed protein product [Trifolium pratense]|uniref:Uncharacterized protein n=1 Tax=Trifolium pratense TaxID=57577 RepID=A0ACB0J7J7_TRIPR|nr:unnamed protein product [Trifolium pratense]